MNMQWFYNLGLAKKLTAAFLVVMSFTVLLGVFSIYRLAAVESSLAEMTGKWVPGADVLRHLAADIAVFRGYEMQHILSGTKEEKRQWEKEMEALNNKIKNNLASYEKLVALPVGQELGRGLLKAWEDYLVEHDKITELSRQDKNVEAIALSKGSAKIQFDKAGESVDGNIKYISEMARETGARGKSLYTSSRNMIIGLVVAGFALGLWLTHFIVHRVTCRSLGWALKTLNRLADGDLTQNINVKSNEEIGQLFGAMKRIIEKLREFSSHVNQLTHDLTGSSKELLATTEAMNRSAQEQTGQTELVAGAVVEMSQTFTSVAGNADQASQASRETSQAAQTGFATVEEVMAEMRKIVGSVQASSVTIGKLGQSSRKIGDIIATIEEVADQTNLLALNAAIEAARAGEHGRGFAVVADEVRALAERTGKATKEISSMIKSIQQDTAQAVTSMMTSKKEVDSGLVKAEEARSALEYIVEVSGRSMDMIQQIATATEEQSVVTEQVSSNIETIAENTRSSASAIDQLQESSRMLAKLSEDLEETATWFKVA